MASAHWTEGLLSERGRGAWVARVLAIGLIGYSLGTSLGLYSGLVLTFELSRLAKAKWEYGKQRSFGQVGLNERLGNTPAFDLNPGWLPDVEA